MERETPLISVIVPVYNVEAYVADCLRSLAAQTYPRIEIIVVDDASTDGSGRICDAWAAEEDRIRLVRFPENRGLSAARNEGVRRAGGAFITFVDSDDFAEPELLEKLYQSLRQSGADISICRAEGLKVKNGPGGTYSREEAVNRMARRSCFLWTAWGKLYPAELVRRHPFDERAVCCEDLLFFYQMLKAVETVSFLPEPLYHYLCREGSLINSGIDRRRCTALSVLERICEDASGCFPAAEAGFRQIALNTSVRLAMQAVEGGTKDGRLFDYLNEFQRTVRRHFRWEALRLCPEKKDAAAELLLYAGAPLFWAFASAYRQMKSLQKNSGGRME